MDDRNTSIMISFQATRTVPWRFAPTFNWGRLIGDPAFYNALKNTLLILVIQVPVMISLAIVMSRWPMCWRSPSRRCR